MSSKYNKPDLQKLIDEGKTLSEIGKIYGVSRQRMFQVFNRLGLVTKENQQKQNMRRALDLAIDTLTNKYQDSDTVKQIQSLIK